ncbi:MAG: hypothetical protein SPL05_01360 [Eubacteriales bacterium]|nr:hypothetical protein [Eubacteriales bacterium]
MRIYFSMPQINGPSILCLGVFDGLHLGHKTIIQKAVELSEIELSPVIVYSFDKRPAEFLTGAKPNLLTTHMQKAKLLHQFGVHALCIDHFDAEVAKIEPEVWLERLCKAFKPEHIFTGYNYTFGNLGRGNNQMLKQFEQEYGYTLHVTSEVLSEELTVSSTRIREHIQKGEIEQANALLGYAYTMPMRLIKIEENKYYFEALGEKIQPSFGNYAVELYQHHFNSNAILQFGNQIIVESKQVFPFRLKEKVAIRFTHCL